MQRSEQINELVAALCKAQTEFEPVYKETDNPAYRSKYADLATIIKATGKALNKNGLVIVQSVACQVETSTVAIETMLAHSSGQWLSDTLHLPGTMRDRFDSQSVGSSITYGRRYGWQSICGVAADVDDDGNASVGIGSSQAAQAIAQRKIFEMTGDFITLTPYDSEEGPRFSLSGTGVSIIKAELTGQDKGALDWMQDGNGVSINGGLGAQFEELCRKHKVKCSFVNPTIPKSNLVPQLEKSIEVAQASKDPVITRCEQKTGKKGVYLAITWDGIDMNIFDRKAFPLFLECFAKKVPVFMETEKNGKYDNFKRLVRMDGRDMTDEQMQAPPSGEMFAQY